MISHELVALVEHIVNSKVRAVTHAGTITSYTPGAVSATVTFDGSSVAVPVKVFGNVAPEPGDRVGLIRVGSEWVVFGTLNQHRGPYFAARHAANPEQIIPNATWTAVALDTMEVDTHGGWSSGDNTKYVPKVAGWYTCAGQLTYDLLTGATTRSIAVGFNGAQVYKVQLNANPPDGGTAIATSGDVYCNGTTDYLQLLTFQSAGGAVSLYGNEGAVPQSNPRLVVSYRSPAT